MLLALGIVLTAWFVGLYRLARTVFSGWQPLELLGLVLVSSSLVLPYVHAGLSLVFPYAVSDWIWLAIVVGAAAWFNLRKNSLKNEETEKKSALAAAWLFTGGVGIAFLLLLIRYMFPAGDGGWQTAGPVWGDGALHLSLFSWFGSQSKLILELPIYSGQPLSYPFLIDYAAAMLGRAGFSVQSSFIVSGFIPLLGVASLLWWAGYRLSKSIFTATVAPLAWLVFTSWAGVFTAARAFLDGGLAAVEAKVWGYDPEAGLYVYNGVFGSLLPQRSAILGMGTVLILILFLFYASRRKSVSLLQAIWMGMLLACMPFAHLHSLIIVAMFLLAWLLGSWKLARSQWARLLPILILPALFAFPVLLWQTRAIPGDFSQMHFGWYAEKGELLRFWWRNIGILLPWLVVALPIGIWRKWRIEKWLLGFVALGGFLLINVMQLQPNLYDNSKILLYVLLFAFYLFTDALAELMRKVVWARIPVLLATGLFLAASLLAGFAPELSKQYLFVSDDGLVFAEKVKEAVPAEAIVVTSHSHNHPVSMMSGRRILLGYRGWLWTYGINVNERYQDVSRVYKGTSKSELLAEKYGADYLVVGPDERQEWSGLNVDVLGDTPVLAYKNYKLYSLRNPENE